MIVFNYFLTAIIWVISIMPFWILYGISDFMYVDYILYRRLQEKSCLYKSQEFFSRKIRKGN